MYINWTFVNRVLRTELCITIHNIIMNDSQKVLYKWVIWRVGNVLSNKTIIKYNVKTVRLLVLKYTYNLYNSL